MRTAHRHTRHCLAKALICAVENVRDVDPEVPGTNADMVLADYVALAEHYYDDGYLSPCTCVVSTLGTVSASDGPS